MKLIKIEALGFKSFVEKINFSFDGGIVGISGSNEVGKSNINNVRNVFQNQDNSNKFFS